MDPSATYLGEPTTTTASCCTICFSWFPEHCPCTKLASTHSKTAARNAAGYAHELACREQLANGLPPDLNTCPYHQDMLHDLARDINTPERRLKPPTAGAHKLFDECLTDESALLPLCNSCGVDAGVLWGTPNDGFVVANAVGHDTCVCASTILSIADCAFCEVGRIEASKELAILKRSVLESRTLTCECGELVLGEELVRKCVGCGGMKTAPFANFAGQELRFEEAGAGLDLFCFPDKTQTATRKLAALLAPAQLAEQVRVKGKGKGKATKRKRRGSDEQAGRTLKHPCARLLDDDPMQDVDALFEQRPVGGLFGTASAGEPASTAAGDDVDMAGYSQYAPLPNFDDEEMYGAISGQPDGGLDQHLLAGVTSDQAKGEAEDMRDLETRLRRGIEAFFNPDLSPSRLSDPEWPRPGWLD